MRKEKLVNKVKQHNMHNEGKRNERNVWCDRRGLLGRATFSLNCLHLMDQHQCAQTKYLSVNFPGLLYSVFNFVCHFTDEHQKFNLLCKKPMSIVPKSFKEKVLHSFSIFLYDLQFLICVAKSIKEFKI